MTDKYQFILHIHGPEIERYLTLQVGTTTVGREPGNSLVLANSLISRRHARFDCTDTECTVTDLNSANGTFVNDVKIPAQVPFPIGDKSVIKIGPVEISLEAIKQDEKIEPIPEPLEEPIDKVKPIKEVDPSLQTKGLTNEPAIIEGKNDREEQVVPPGLSIYSTRLLDFLPGIYQDDFMSRFLALFESILFPIEWNIDNFDLFLDPGTAPIEFLPWLMNWFEISFNSTWSEAQRRRLLKEANQIYARRGTRWALSRALEIYIGQRPEIIESSDGLSPYTFKVKIPISKKNLNQELIEQLINANKPAYTAYTLEFSEQA